MDTLSRLILVCLLALGFGQAHAAGTVAGSGSVTTWIISADTVNCRSTVGPYEAAVACITPAARIENPYVMDGTIFLCYNTAGVYQSGGTCSVGQGGTYSVSTSVTGGCPSNSTGTSTCTCNVGYEPNAGATACVASGACPAAGSPVSMLYDAYPSSSTGTLCNSGCVVQGSVTVTYGGSTSAGGTFTSTGVSCNPDASVPAPATVSDPTPLNCDPGYAEGTLNGTAVCVPATTTATGPATTTKDGTGATTGTTTDTTVCTGSSCTTTTTTKNGAGVTTGTVARVESLEGFCDASPGSPLCGAGSGGSESSIGQSCAAGIASQTCEGDAIQCAIAKEQFKRNCEFYTFPTGTQATGEAAIARGDTRASDHPKADANVTTTSVGSAVDQTDLTPGSCPADVTVAVGSGSVVMPWSQICTPATWLGNLLVSLTGLAWVFIAFKTG